MNLQENIKRILREETSNETNAIKQILDLTILNDYRDYLCDIEVRHPKDRKVLQGQKEWTEYALVFTFLGGDGSKTMKYYDRCDKIMDEAWRVVYDYTNIATQVYSRHEVDCNDSY